MSELAMELVTLSLVRHIWYRFGGNVNATAGRFIADCDRRESTRLLDEQTDNPQVSRYSSKSALFNPGARVTFVLVRTGLIWTVVVVSPPCAWKRAVS